MTAVNKYSLFFFSVIVLLSGCSKENKSDDTTNPSRNCWLKEKKTSGENLQPYSTTYEFNSAGLLSKESYFDNGDLRWYEAYEYDAEGKLMSWSRYSSGGYISDKRIASFGTDGRISGYTAIHWEPWDIDTSYYHFAYEQDKFIGFTLNGADTTSKLIRYYQNGNLVKTEDLNGNNDIGEYHIYTYSDVLNKQFDQEARQTFLSRALPSKYLPATHKIFNVSLNKIEYDISYTYTTNAKGDVVEMKVKTTRYLEPPYSNMEFSSTTKYTYQCN